jgi:hypothetical protein
MVFSQLNTLNRINGKIMFVKENKTNGNGLF